jgi:hypothetical protein
MKYLNPFKGIANIEDAKAAAMIGAGAAGFAVLTTALLIVIGMTSPASWVDAGLFALISWLIFKMSRIAAVSGLVLFLLEKVYQIVHVRLPVSGYVVAIFVTCGFIWGIRGTFAFHRFRKADTYLGSPTGVVR